MPGGVIETMNMLKTTMLLVALTSLFLGVGYFLGGPVGLVIALGFAGAMNFFAYWSSDKLALRMAGAHEVSLQEAPRLHTMVQAVADQARLPKPKVYVIQNDTPNAFATGRNPQHAAVAVTTGIQSLLSERELRGVLGHELPREEPRYPYEFDRRDAGGGDQHAGLDEPLIPGPRRLRRADLAGGLPAGPARGRADPGGHLAGARIPGRHLGR